MRCEFIIFLMKIIYLALLSLLVLSCGLKPESQQVETRYARTSIGEPLLLSFSNDKCAQFDLFGSYPGVDLVIAGQKKYSQMTNFLSEQLFSDIELNGNYIYKVYPKLELVKSGVDFKPCKVDEDYDDKSYEDAAISILKPITDFKKNFSEFHEELRLEKLKLKVLPLIEHNTQFNTGHEVNNAYYSYSSKEIVFLPQGRDKFGHIPFNGTPLWKFPMVPLHEYGHHIFASKVYSSNKNINTPDKELCFDNSDETSSFLDNRGKDDKRRVGKWTAISALNEGFADLFAYYGNQTTRKLYGMGCMIASRDVESNTFFNSDLKVLNQKALNDFSSTTFINYDFCDVDTDYQDVHIIGAIYARAWFDIFSKTKLSDEEKLKVLIHWIEKIREIASKDLKVQSVLQRSFNAMEETVKEDLNQLICPIQTTYFPEFKSVFCMK